MPLLDVRGLSKHFVRKHGLFRPPSIVKAVDDVSFAIDEGEMFGLVGESGSGKSTIGRCILRLIEPTAGDVHFRNENVLSFPKARMRLARRDMQIVFQDPYSSLNPRMRVGDDRRRAAGDSSTRKPRRTARAGRRAVRAGWTRAGSPRRYPHEFSGGQRQRIGIARALALNPAFVIADEAVSALDVSIQAQVVALLLDLHSRLKLTFLFIAHDLRLVENICSRVAVMYLGRIVEMGETGALFSQPTHPYTRALLSAIPVLDPDAPRQRIELDPVVFQTRRAASGSRRRPLGRRLRSGGLR